MSKSTTIEAEATLGLTKMSRNSVKVLESAGMTVEAMGFHRLANGAGLISIETCQDAQQVLRDSIMEDDGKDAEALAAKCNALANIVKSQASLLKVVSGLPQAQPDGGKRARKSFASSAPIDVSPKAP